MINHLRNLHVMYINYLFYENNWYILLNEIMTYENYRQYSSLFHIQFQSQKPQDLTNMFLKNKFDMQFKNIKSSFFQSKNIFAIKHSQKTFRNKFKGIKIFTKDICQKVSNFAMITFHRKLNSWKITHLYAKYMKVVKAKLHQRYHWNV